MSGVPHIVIADDQEAVREICTSVATALGYRATGVASGQEAMRLWQQDPPDVLVSDVRLPDMSGVELLKRLRQVWAAVPVLLTTAYGTIGMAVEAMKLGAADYITKPFEIEEMRLLLQACVRQTQLEREARGLRLAARGPYADGNLIGNSPAMQRIFRLVGKVAQSILSNQVSVSAGCASLNQQVQAIFDTARK